MPKVELTKTEIRYILQELPRPFIYEIDERKPKALLWANVTSKLRAAVRRSLGGIMIAHPAPGSPPIPWPDEPPLIPGQPVPKPNRSNPWPRMGSGHRNPAQRRCHLRLQSGRPRRVHPSVSIRICNGRSQLEPSRRSYLRRNSRHLRCVHRSSLLRHPMCSWRMMFVSWPIGLHRC